MTRIPSPLLMRAQTNNDPPPKKEGALGQGAALNTRNTHRLLAHLLAKRNATLRIACCALDAQELAEWLETKHDRLAVAVVEANRS